MYGERDDPYAVLSRLSSALGSTPSPGEVLSVITATVGQALKIPYVSILLDYGKGVLVINAPCVQGVSGALHVAGGFYDFVRRRCAQLAGWC